MDIKIISEKISQLRKAGKYEDVLNLYKEKIHGNFNSDILVKENWIIFSVIYSLRKLDKANSALDFYFKSMKQTPGKETHISLLREIGWCLVAILSSGINKKVRDANFFEEIGIKTINFLRLISFQEEYLLYTKLYFLLNKWEMLQEKPDWQTIISRLEKHKPEEFTIETEIFKNYIKGKEKLVELASDREEYYIQLTKALFQAGEIEKCIDFCKEALSAIPGFHYGNNLWITRRLSHCYTDLGNYNAAINGFTEILKKKSDWFIEFEFALLYFKMKDITKSISLGCRAALNGGYSAYKVNMFIQLGHIFSLSDQKDLSCLHFSLSRAVRLEQNWKIPQELELLKETFNCIYSELPANEQYNKLKAVWEKYSGMEIKNEYIEGYGEVSAILHDGSNGDGFINSVKGESIYFRFPVIKRDYNKIKKGAKVWFRAKFREHKGKRVLNATIIKLI